MRSLAARLTALSTLDLARPPSSSRSPPRTTRSATRARRRWPPPCRAAACGAWTCATPA
ncbi:hypothetical protein ACFQX7_40385 [Luedemannella flava]